MSTTTNGQDWKPRKATLDLIDAAMRVMEQAAADGYKLTLRAVYYGLVSTNEIPNNEKSYKKLSAVLSKARWAGLVDMSAIDDLGRIPATLPSWEDPGDFAAGVIPQYRTDWWRDSPVFCRSLGGESRRCFHRWT